MTERDGIYMMEQDVRLRIQSILDMLRKAHSLGEETKAGTDIDSVDYHIKYIIKVGGGIWNESCAKDYIEDLEAEVGQRTEEHRHFAY
jgi:hypothetical protein